jgi:hypothetical protein
VTTARRVMASFESAMPAAGSTISTFVVELPPQPITGAVQSAAVVFRGPVMTSPPGPSANRKP